MKKLVILLIAVLAVGAAALYLLTYHADLQVSLPTSYAKTEDEGEKFVPEISPTASEVKFSQKNAFYSEDIDVELSCGDGNALIYYTTDGNDPTEASDLYTEPIHLSAKNRETCTTIKAFAVNGGEHTETAVKSYIVGRNVFSRFTSDTLVFVLSADEYDLYDYYHGIAVPGYLRDEFLKNEYKGGEVQPTDPANYNMRGRESERPMYVEVFDSTGEQLVSQASGARVVGGYSRDVSQKSWRLFARNVYSEGNGKFKYPFFTENTDGNGNFITRYDRITLRNGANDREFAGVRDELSMTLAAEMGFPDTQAVRPAAVYLNGEYYGFAWLHEAYSDDYLEMMYGGVKENYRILGTEELDMESDDEEDAQALADWERVMSLAEKDLTVDLYFNEFCSLVDLDDLMMYYAMQIYIDNKDWPNNNFKVWRYYPTDGEEVTSPYLDGKWRFLLFDAEFAWGLYGNGYSDDTLYSVLTGKHMKGESRILRALLARPDMCERFANTVCELVGGAFSADNIKAKLDMLVSESGEEQTYALKNGYTSEWANEWTFADSRSQIVDFAELRPMIMDRIFKRNFGVSDEKYTVNVRAPSGADVKMGCLRIASGQSGSVKYYNEYSSVLAAEPYEGYAFDHWEVNGAAITDSPLRLDSSMADESGNITVSLYLAKVPYSGTVYVSELYTAGSGDWIKLYNPTDAQVNIRGWHLSDKKNEPDRYTIPDTDIPAGGSTVIVLKNNNDTTALMKHQTNFSLKTGETLYFSDKDMNVISEVPVLELKEGRSLIRGDDGRYHIGSVSAVS
ncbi:MAG: CotH kinase family protein [Ruminiclostridium sp.]|nr:CotH kinase family protein [Ruminiclostridium sp.]